VTDWEGHTQLGASVGPSLVSVVGSC
jgi:hypothetical protein